MQQNPRQERISLCIRIAGLQVASLCMRGPTTHSDKTSLANGGFICFHGSAEEDSKIKNQGVLAWEHHKLSRNSPHLRKILAHIKVRPIGIGQVIVFFKLIFVRILASLLRSHFSLLKIHHHILSAPPIIYVLSIIFCDDSFFIDSIISLWCLPSAFCWCLFFHY